MATTKFIDCRIIKRFVLYKLGGRAVALRRPLSAEDRLRYQDSPRLIYVALGGVGRDFSNFSCTISLVAMFHLSNMNNTGLKF